MCFRNHLLARTFFNYQKRCDLYLKNINMMDSKTFLQLFVAALLTAKVSGNEDFPRARDVTWSSINFKTLLTWNPKPTNYSYTVEFSGVGKDRERNPNCIQTTETECDLTRMLTDLKETYIADVLSQPMPGMTTDLVESPYTSSKKFCPYQETKIGKPQFKVEVNEEKTKVTLRIEDPLSVIYQGDRFLNMRDIFKDDLEYKVIYRKAKSTGKKEQTTASNEITVDVDKGESYCFSVRAVIPSRSTDGKEGQLSDPQCSAGDAKTFIEEYGLGVIAGGILVMVAMAVTVVALIVTCCRCSRGGGDERKADELLSLA